MLGFAPLATLPLDTLPASASEVVEVVVVAPDRAVAPPGRIAGETVTSPLPEQTVALAWQPVCPSEVFRRQVAVASQPYLSLAPAPEQTSPSAPVVYPDRVPRPGVRAAEQWATSEIPSAPEEAAPLDWGPVYPSEIGRRQLGPWALPWLSFAAAPERTAPLGLVIHPDAVPRPAEHASRQWAVTSIAVTPEEATPLDWGPVYPSEIVRSGFVWWATSPVESASGPEPAEVPIWAIYPSEVGRPPSAVRFVGTWVSDVPVSPAPPPPPPPPPPPVVAPLPSGGASASMGGASGGVTWVSMPTGKKVLFSELEMVPLRLLLTKLTRPAITTQEAEPARGTGDLEALFRRSEQKIFEEDTRADVQAEYQAAYERERELDRLARSLAMGAQVRLFEAEQAIESVKTAAERQALEARIGELEARVHEAEARIADLERQALWYPHPAPALVPVAPLGQAPSSTGWPWYAYVALALGAAAIVYVVWPKSEPAPEPDPPRKRRKKRGKLRQ